MKHLQKYRKCPAVPGVATHPEIVGCLVVPADLQFGQLLLRDHQAVLGRPPVHHDNNDHQAARHVVYHEDVRVMVTTFMYVMCLQCCVL